MTSVDEINEIIVQADELIRQDQIEEALELYQKAISLAQEIDWQERIVQINQMIEDVNKNQEKKRLEDERRQKREEELRKKEEEKKKIDDARSRLDQRKNAERQQKMDALNKKKDQENELSTKAYDLLEQGSISLKAQDFETCLQAFRSALENFRTINWPAEVERVEELIRDAEVKYQEYQEKIEKNQTQTKEIEEKFQEYENQVESESEIKIHKQNELQEKQKKHLNQEEIASQKSDEAFSLMDDGNSAANEKQFDTAIEKFQEALEIFEKINYTNEAEKVKIQISTFKDKKRKYDQEQQRISEMQKKAQEEEMEIENMAQASERLKQKKMQENMHRRQKETEDQDYAQSVADEVFAKVDEIENKVKEYDAQVKKGKILELDCPYEEAIEIYNKGQIALRDISWQEQSQRLSDGVNTYQEKLAKDNKLRDFEQKKIKSKKQEENEVQRQISASQRLKQKELDERKKNLSLEQERKNHEDQVQNECLDLLENAKQFINNKQFTEAIAIYEDVIQKYQEINWDEGVHLTEETLEKTKQDYESYHRKLDLEKREEEELLREQEELEEKIKESNEESERQQLEAQKMALERKMNADREKQANEELLNTLEQANQKILSDQYDEALELFNQALQIVKQIDWPGKEQQILETIIDAKQKKEMYLKKMDSLEYQRQKQEELQQALENRLAEEATMRESKANEIQSMLKQQKQKTTQEKTLSDEAWKFMDIAEKDVKLSKLYPALHYVHKALANFIQINWTRESATTKTRLSQIHKMITPPIIDLNELQVNEDFQTEEELCNKLSEIMTYRKVKDFNKAIELLEKAQELINTIQMPNTYNESISFKTVLENEQQEFQADELDEEAHPTKEKAMRKIESARKKAENFEYEDAIQQAEISASMFSKMSFDKEANTVNAEIKRWRYQKDKYEEKQKQSTLESEYKNQELSEEDEKQKLIEDRKRQRREERKKSQ